MKRDRLKNNVVEKLISVSQLFMTEQSGRRELWIFQFKGQEREPPREYLDRESHYVCGKRYLLKVVEVRIIRENRSGPRIAVLGSLFGSANSRQSVRLAD